MITVSKELMIRKMAVKTDFCRVAVSFGIKKELEWNPLWEGKKVFIEFDGAYMNSTVWLNGYKLGFYPNGYLGFSYDLTLI